MSAVLGNIRYISHYMNFEELKADEYVYEGKIVFVGNGDMSVYQITTEPIGDSELLDNGMYATLVPLSSGNVVQRYHLTGTTDEKGYLATTKKNIISCERVTASVTEGNLNTSVTPFSYTESTKSYVFLGYPTCLNKEWGVYFLCDGEPLASKAVDTYIYYIEEE